jgi:hypothetical protein
MPFSSLLDAFESLAGLRRRARLVLLVSLAVDAVLLLALPATGGLGPYRGPLAAVFALVSALVAVAAGPWIAVAVALLAAVFQLKLVVAPTATSLYAFLITVTLWVLSAAVIGLIADLYRERLADRERRMRAALIAEKSGHEMTERYLADQREANRLATALESANRLIHSSLDFDETMQDALEEGVRELDVDGGVVEIREDRGWVVRHQTGLGPARVGVVLEADEAPIAARSVRERTVIDVEDIDLAEGSGGFARANGMRAAVAVPLIVKDAVVGCMLFLSRDPRRFSTHERRFVGNLGASAALAFENARLYEQQRDVAMDLQKQFKHQPPVQESLEFGLHEQTAGEAALVGGDFFDVFKVDVDRVAVLIGDVAGKGIKAAGLTETVRSTVRALALVDARPDVVLRRANEVLLRRETPDHVTAFLLVVDMRSGEAWYGSAGHPPPLHCGAGEPAFLQCHFGAPLGAFRLPYEARHIVLRPDDTLVFYTDGVTEARRRGRLFGEARLREALAASRLLAPQALAERLGSVVSTYADALQDDVQIVVMRFVGRSEEEAREPAEPESGEAGLVAVDVAAEDREAHDGSASGPEGRPSV